MSTLPYGSDRLVSVVKKVPHAATRPPINVQHIDARVEQGGLGFYPCWSELGPPQAKHNGWESIQDVGGPGDVFMVPLGDPWIIRPVT